MTPRRFNLPPNSQYTKTLKFNQFGCKSFPRDEASPGGDEPGRESTKMKCKYFVGKQWKTLFSKHTTKSSTFRIQIRSAPSTFIYHFPLGELRVEKQFLSAFRTRRGELFASLFRVRTITMKILLLSIHKDSSLSSKLAR